MKKTIEFKYEASYCVSHEPNFQEDDIWFVFHGYGQLATFFIQKFRFFDDSKRLIIAPEGTNYAYLEGFDGRVGANWMTSHERDLAIANNHSYIDELVKQILSRFKGKKPRIHILGFSQGAATASRWASRGSLDIASLVLWSGGFAADLNMDFVKKTFSATTVTVVFGSKDLLVTEESLSKQDKFLSDLGKNYQKIVFLGGHELNFEVLEKIFLLST